MKPQSHLSIEEPRRSEGRIIAGSVIERPGFETQRLWFSLPEEHADSLSQSCDPFLLGALFLAMKSGHTLLVHGEVSPSLLTNLEEFQSAWHCWLPHRYRKIDIRADVEKEAAQADGLLNLCTFSGGVDACFTVMRHSKLNPGRFRRMLHSAIMVHGFDIPLGEDEQFSLAVKNSKNILANTDIELIPVATNFKELDHYWGDAHGAGLTFCLMMLQGKFSAGLVASSCSYNELYTPWGSSPVTDHLMSSRNFSIVHDGSGFSRNEKVQLVATWPEAMQYLRVCWEGEERDRNCGVCEKCIRTILNFRVMGVGLPASFKHDVSDRQISNLRGLGPDENYDLKKIYKQARAVSLQEPWVKILRNTIWRNQVAYHKNRLWSRISAGLRRRFRSLTTKRLSSVQKSTVRSEHEPLKILIENGCYHLRNMGDVAMLQITVERLGSLWPDAEIQVLTDDFDLLKRYAPRAIPLNSRGRHLWFHDGLLLGGLHRFIPGAFTSYFYKLERHIQRYRPDLALAWIRRREKLRGRDSHELDLFVSAVSEADLLVVSGGGDLNDAFADYASTLLDVVRLANCFNVPVSLFGQGVGPMENDKLVAEARAVLPKVNHIYVREKLAAPALLRSLGVTPNHFAVTGDDAIEMAYNARSIELGQGIGVNLRLASYSSVGSNRLNLLQSALGKASHLHAAQLLPVPISFHDQESDVATIQAILTDIDLESDGGAGLDSPQRLIDQVSRCRCVITGSYHTAVFALSQGIPAVCLAKSAYYIDKFQGLADQFGCGCEVLLFDEALTEKKILKSIDNAWHAAEQLRPELLAAAQAQIMASTAAYQRVFNDFESQQTANASGSNAQNLNPVTTSGD